MTILFSKGSSIYDVHSRGGGGQPHVDACGRGGGVEQVYDVHMVCFLEHNATVPH